MTSTIPVTIVVVVVVVELRRGRYSTEKNNTLATQITYLRGGQSIDQALGPR